MHKRSARQLWCTFARLRSCAKVPRASFGIAGTMRMCGCGTRGQAGPRGPFRSSGAFTPGAEGRSVMRRLTHETPPRTRGQDVLRRTMLDLDEMIANLAPLNGPRGGAVIGPLSSCQPVPRPAPAFQCGAWATTRGEGTRGCVCLSRRRASPPLLDTRSG